MKDNKYYINKILGFCDNILEYTENYNFEDFVNDSKTFNACILCICQIGEFSKNFSSEFLKKYSFIDWYSIKGTRNRFIHDYEGINNKILWEIVSESIPKLKLDLTLILKEL